MNINTISNTDRQKFTSVLNNYRAEFLKHQEQQRQYATQRKERYMKIFSVIIIFLVGSYFLYLIRLNREYNSRPEVIAARQEAARVAEQKRIEAEKERQEKERWERIKKSERFKNEIITIAEKHNFRIGDDGTIFPEENPETKTYAHYIWIWAPNAVNSMFFCSDGIRCGKHETNLIFASRMYHSTKQEREMYHFVSYDRLRYAHNALEKYQIQSMFSKLPDQNDVQGAILDVIDLLQRLLKEEK